MGLVGFLVVYFLKKINPNPRKKKSLSEKVAKFLFSAYFFLGSVGFGLVGEFVGFRTIFTCFPTQPSLANRKHTNYRDDGVCRRRHKNLHKKRLQGAPKRIREGRSRGSEGAGGSAETVKGAGHWLSLGVLIRSSLLLATKEGAALAQTAQCAHETPGLFLLFA